MQEFDCCIEPVLNEVSVFSLGERIWLAPSPRFLPLSCLCLSRLTANLFVLESPICVGYSYCSRQQTGKPCNNTDKFTASASRAALVDFFSNKFPELAENDFFITGESYAGVYIPTLSKEILDHAPEINLVGIAVGDPCTYVSLSCLNDCCCAGAVETRLS